MADALAQERADEAHPPGVERLRLEVEAIKRRQEAESKGFFGWTKKWGGVLGLVALLFSVPKGAIDLYSAVRNLNRRPDTQIYQAAYVGWSYEPSQKLLSLNFPLTAINRGDEEDLLVTINARIETASPTPRTLAEFDYTDFRCSETEQPQPLPMPLRIGVQESFSKKCSLSAQLSDESARIFEGTTKTSDALRLTLSASGENKVRHELKICFNPDEDLGADVADPQCFESAGE
jgi:hypothetical protein